MWFYLQDARSSCPPTTWMKLISWGIALPSSPTGSCAVWAPLCSSRPSWERDTTWRWWRRTSISRPAPAAPPAAPSPTPKQASRRCEHLICSLAIRESPYLYYWPNLKFSWCHIFVIFIVSAGGQCISEQFWCWTGQRPWKWNHHHRYITGLLN